MVDIVLGDEGSVEDEPHDCGGTATTMDTTVVEDLCQAPAEP